MGNPRPTLRSEFERAERFAARAKVAAVLALLNRTDADAAEHEHLARLSTSEVRSVMENVSAPGATTSGAST